MSQVYLLLGANLGDRSVQMKKAFYEIEKQIGKITRYSTIYETAAWGKEEEPSYLNQAVQVETDLSPLTILHITNEIENKLGRVRYIKWGSRIIDIDILFYDNILIESEQLKIPHPLLHHRKFVLIPLSEIAPNFIHPVFNKTVSELLRDVEDDLSVESFLKGS